MSGFIKWNQNQGKMQHFDNITYSIEKLSENKVKITVYWGKKPNSGYKIKIKDILLLSEQIIIKYEKKYPNEKMYYSDVITYPKDSKEIELAKPLETYHVTLISE